MRLLKCGQFGDRPGLLVTVTDRAADTSINMRHECYKIYARAIERALKAEALARELVGVIDDLCGQINQCGLDEQMWEVYRKAKEVLGDETR